MLFDSRQNGESFSIFDYNQSEKGKKDMARFKAVRAGSKWEEAVVLQIQVRVL